MYALASMRVSRVPTLSLLDATYTCQQHVTHSVQPEAYTIQHVTATAEQFREFGAAVPASPLKCLGERAAFAYATSLTTHTFRQVRVRVRVRVRVTPRLCVRARAHLIHASLFRAVC